MLRRSRLRILTPVNGTAASKHAFRWSCQLARNSRADLLALYVFEIPMEFPVESLRGPADLMEGESILHQIEQIATAEHCRVDAAMVAARNAGPAIVREASGKAIDLLVVGMPYRRVVSSLPLGATTDFILKNAPCQVVVSREPAPTGHQRQD